MKKQIIFGIFFSLLFSSWAAAAPRDKAQMKAAAAKVLNAQRSAKRLAPKRVSDFKILKETEAYEILGCDGTGFAVISADDRVPEVLGYSTGKYSEGRNENFQWWLNAVDEVVKYAVNNNVLLTTTKPNAELYPTSVEPMLTTKWDQDGPYNNLCPTYAGSVKCLTGCVATAIAQVLNYHRLPAHGIGTRTIYYPQNQPSGQAVTADFENDCYDWDNMLDTYVAGQYNEAQALAVATLMRDCGVAVNMEYGGPSEGSGAYSDEAAAGLRTYFGFSEAKMLDRTKFSEETWMNLIYQELSENGPLYYGGSDATRGGHAFVLHGYNSDGQVYVNWGWSGSDDGYYDISLLNPSYYKFLYGQDMIIGVKGEPVDLAEDSVTLATAGTLGQHIGIDKIGVLGTLKVTGDINSSDLLLLRKLAGVDEKGEKTSGLLQNLDLSEARFVAGGNPYLVDGSQSLTTTTDELPQRAFYGCNYLKSLKLPAGLKTFGDGALACCSRLTSIEIGTPAATANFILDKGIVWNTDSTEIIAVLPSNTGELTIRKGVTSLHDYALAGCARLSKVVLPSSLEKIGCEGFKNCSGLTTIRVSTKEAPTLTGSDVFKGIIVYSCKLYIPSGTKTKYSKLAQWSIFHGDNYDSFVEYGTTVKVRNTIRNYGAENPEFHYSVQGDPIEGEPVLSCDATPLSPAGKYAITISAGTIKDEMVDLVDGYLIIQKVKAKATVQNCSRAVGQENPKFTLTFEKLVNDETEPSWLVEPEITTTADADSPAGEYPIIVTEESGIAENYNISFVAGILTVTESTGITDVEKEAAEASMAVYDLQGRKVATLSPSEIPTANLPKGIYIRNGKKLYIDN